MPQACEAQPPLGRRGSCIGYDFESHADRVPPLPPETRPSAKTPTPSEELYDRVSTMGLTWAGRQADLAEAERLVNEALKKEPNDPFLLLGMARVKLHKGFLHGNDYTPASLEEADGLLTRVLAVAPDLPEAHVQRGYHLFFRKDEAHAKEEALLALKAGPSTRAHRLLGDLAFHAGDLEEAEKQSLEALALATRRQASYGTLEQVYHQLGDYEAAERCYDRTIEADPTNPYTRASLASTFVDHGLYDRAIEMGESAQKILSYEYGRETLARAHNEKGAEALWTGKDAGLAKAEFEKALTVDPKSAHAHYGLGAYYRKMAVARHDRALLKRSNDELEQAAKLDRDPTLAKAARADNDLLSVR